VSSTRHRILAASRELFTARGVTRTHLSHIAEASGIRRPHLYRHFANKDDILVALIVDDLRRAHVARRARLPLGGPTRELVVESILIGREMAGRGGFADLGVPLETTFRLVREWPVLLDVESEYWGDIIAAGRQRGDVRPDIDVRDVSRWILFLQTSLFAFGEQYFGGDLRRHLELFVADTLAPR
jgi:AcrR family transcriptional regulator